MTELQEEQKLPTCDVGRMLSEARDAQDYEHEYTNYLVIFEQLARTTMPHECVNVPRCWAPFIAYMGHHVASVSPQDWDGETLSWEMFYQQAKDKRLAVEVAAACRPELVDALYMFDTKWGRGVSAAPDKLRAFPVTTNNSFFRPEVLDYMQKLRDYKPPSGVKHAVLVPCAAQKPYPAPLHTDVMARFPEWQDCHLIITTGVLGLVPLDFAGEAPEYDSGLPNKGRVRDTVAWYFTRHSHVYQTITVYSDFYAEAVHEGLWERRHLNVAYMFGFHPRDTYENLRSLTNLDNLETRLREAHQYTMDVLNGDDSAMESPR